MRSVEEIPELENIPVLVRTSLNAEVVGGKVTSDFRLRSALPTIQYLQKRHARVVLISHITGNGNESLRPMYEAMRTWIPKMEFCDVATGARARAAVRTLPPGGVLMLENLRRYAGEQKNSDDFARDLADLADVFVQDSFDVCHRKHASVVGVPDYLPAYAGLQVVKEVAELSKAREPKSPSLAIIGGAKFATKQPVLNTLLSKYDRVFVGGALANDFMVESGYSVGASLVSLDADKHAIRRLLKNPKLMLPLDEVVADPGSSVQKGEVVALDMVPRGKAILDDGPKTVEALANLSMKAKVVLWNGPLGLYENGFVESTLGLARAIAASGAYSILGGGDTVAAVEELGLSSHFSFISTGGGAMLDYIAYGTLPGIEALSH